MMIESAIPKPTVEDIKRSIAGKLQRHHGCGLKDATPQQVYSAVVSTVRDQIMRRLGATREAMRAQHTRKLYYLSVEFLVGRSLHANVLNLLETDEYRQALADLGLSMDGLLREEPEPGLGNGGLGRLAACFLDSLTTLNLPAMGCTIRYEYGLFRQRIIDGQQVELPDNWLEFGNQWEVPALEDTVEVHFGGHLEETWASGVLSVKHTDYKTVLAVPYDMPVVGYGTDMTNVLRMWRARSPKRIDLHSFGAGDYAQAAEEREIAEVISQVLYPEDNHYEGKLLRLKQHYFFTSATLQYILSEYKRTYGSDLHALPEQVVIHINDTHPGMAIPELMRLLMDQEGFGWSEAQALVQRTFAYTNHTIMAEALEKWPEEMVKTLLPRIYQILQEINRRFCDRLWNLFPGQWDRIAKLAILAYDQVHMANLSVWGSFSVNGVSQLHGEILKRDTFRDYYRIMPEKFGAITNGITHRRWLMLCNPGLTALIEDAIGQGWRGDPEQLQRLLEFRDDAAFLERFAAVKRANKERLPAWFVKTQGVAIDPASLFDVQAKRLHEYKRQLLNILHVLVLYNRMADDPSYTIQPRCFIFGAKASPGYRRAKYIIRLINAVADLVAKHPRARQMLQVVFLENYNVSAAEILIPATELSEQLSTATKEASGTGNMKFMLNGAVTIGTLDGANVEMHERVGDDNIYLFGLTADEVAALYASGYNSKDVYNANQDLREAIDLIEDGSLSPEKPRLFADIYNSLLYNDSGLSDQYLVLRDFASYAAAHRRLVADFADRRAWNRKAVINVANAGYFSSDRAIREYNEGIWNLT